MTSAPLAPFSPLEEPVESRQRAWVEVNTAAIQTNVRALLRHVGPGTQLMAVVKADAYGHGALPVARAALEAGASCFGVATLAEGVQLRRAGISAPVLVLGNLTQVEELRSCLRFVRLAAGALLARRRRAFAGLSIGCGGVPVGTREQ
jgi:alanine racemase